MKIRPAAITIALALTLTGCGGGDKGDAPASSAPKMSATDLASKVGCTDYTSDSEEMFVKEGGTCTTDAGETVQLATFGDEKAQSDYLEVAQSFGGTWVTGDGWAVSADSADVAEKIAAATGGAVS